MKLLYITPLWSGLKPFFYEGSDKVTGMPAFNNVFKSFLIDEKIDKIEVILFIYGDKNQIKIPLKYSNKLKIHPFYIQGRFSLYKVLISAYLKGVKVTSDLKIDVVYGHGTISFLASLIGISSKIKHFRRLYGTFLYPKTLNKKTIITSFFEYLSFKLPADGLIITNDGTHGDKVFDYINTKKGVELHFLLNGINKNPEIKSQFNAFKIENSFFTYIARIDEWKRQHLLIEVLNELKKDNIDFPHAYLVGPIYDKSYKNKLDKLILEYDLNDKVTITGPVNKDEVIFLLKNSKLSFSLYDFSNLGNVFLEGLSLGTPMVAINESGSLNIFPNTIYIPIFEANVIEIKNTIKKVLDNQINLDNIKKEALNYAKNNILSWEERVQIEKKVIISGKEK